MLDGAWLKTAVLPGNAGSTQPRARSHGAWLCAMQSLPRTLFQLAARACAGRVAISYFSNLLIQSMHQ
jgi:hypothetical protein